jgi:hypothetical protein
MTKPIIKIVNVSTGEEIEREMNNDEFAQYEADQAEALQIKIDTEAQVNAKAELLERLGLTEDEAKLLLS